MTEVIIEAYYSNFHKQETKTKSTKTKDESINSYRKHPGAYWEAKEILQAPTYNQLRREQNQILLHNPCSFIQTKNTDMNSIRILQYPSCCSERFFSLIHKIWKPISDPLLQKGIAAYLN